MSRSILRVGTGYAENFSKQTNGTSEVLIYKGGILSSASLPSPTQLVGYSALNVEAVVFHSTSATSPGTGYYRVRIDDQGDPQTALPGALIAYVTASAYGFASASFSVPSTFFTGSFTVKLTSQRDATASSVAGFDVFFSSPDDPVAATPGRPWRGRGFRFGNVGEFPDMDPRDLVHGSSRVYHANSVQSVQQTPFDVDLNDFSGAVLHKSLRGVDQRVPLGVRHYARNSVNVYGEPLLEHISGS